MYNVPVRFDGDIIITDPCYVMRKDYNNQFINTISFKQLEVPRTKNYFTYVRDNGCVRAEDYPDCIMLELDDPRVDLDVKESKEDFINFMKKINIDDEKISEYSRVAYSEMYNQEQEAYHFALLEYVENNPSDDWEYCGCGDSMENLGFETFLCDCTVDGDWSCTTYSTDTGEPIGEFCADAGMVAVFLLDEVLRYNPDFNYHIERPWTTTLIKDFHGTVELHLEDDEVTVVGKGNVNFIGTQTGL